MSGTYAYNELYLPLAQRMLGDMYDFAVNTLDIRLEIFQKMFLGSRIPEQIQRGNPTYVAGKNGCEVAREVILTVTGQEPQEEDAMYTDKSPEYWIGWTLAWYQWESNLPFADIEQAVPVQKMYAMYPVYHEVDISMTVEAMNEQVSCFRAGQQLKRLRAYAGFSQQDLARQSEVALRQIQLFEQGQRDIRKTQGETLLRLSKALNCSIENLLLSADFCMPDSAPLQTELR